MSGFNNGRVAGILLLMVFALGVLTFQVLQTPVLSGSLGIDQVADHSIQIIISVFISLLGGSLSIWIAILLFPVFQRSNVTLAYLYLAFTIVNFAAIANDVISVLSVLELSRTIIGEGDLSIRVADGLVSLVYGRQWWTHHLYLLISCIPVFIMYFGFFISRAVPRALSIFGIVAAIAMAVEMVGVMLGSGISDLLFIPIALVQVTTPLWLIARGIHLTMHES